MTSAYKVFGFSGLFGLAVAGAYWIVTYEWAGTLLLSFMGIAALVIAIYLRRENRGGLAEDDPGAAPGDSSGQTITAFPRGSPWPAGVALGAILLAGGFVYGPWLLVAGGALLLIALLGFARESRS